MLSFVKRLNLHLFVSVFYHHELNFDDSVSFDVKRRQNINGKVHSKFICQTFYEPVTCDRNKFYSSFFSYIVSLSKWPFKL